MTTSPFPALSYAKPSVMDVPMAIKLTCGTSKNDNKIHLPPTNQTLILFTHNYISHYQQLYDSSVLTFRQDLCLNLKPALKFFSLFGNHSHHVSTRVLKFVYLSVLLSILSTIRSGHQLWHPSQLN